MSKLKHANVFGSYAERGADIVTALKSNKPAYDQFVFAMGQLCRAVDREASRIAKERKEWADDPAWEHNAAYHASAAEQFPLESRNAAVLHLAKYYLTELRPSLAYSDV